MAACDGISLRSRNIFRVASHLVPGSPLKILPRRYRCLSMWRPLVFFAAFLALCGLSFSADADTWRGTAPFCKGECLAGETQIGTSSSGDGARCLTGHKALCRNALPTCHATSTISHCYGVVLICQNGYNEAPNGVWHSCDTYACGGCLFGGGGTHALSTLSIGNTTVTATPVANLTCKSGYVWRAAIENDAICVTPPTRDQAAADNRLAASRHLPNSDVCQQGFVWRVVIPTDHVCVTPETRAAVAADSALAPSRVVAP